MDAIVLALLVCVCLLLLYGQIDRCTELIVGVKWKHICAKLKQNHLDNISMGFAKVLQHCKFFKMIF